MDIEFQMYLFYDGGWFRIALVVVSALLGIHLTDLYRNLRVTSRSLLLQDLCQVLGITLLSQGLISYAFPGVRLGRGIMLLGSTITLPGLMLWRMFYSAVVMRVVGYQRILFLGNNSVVREMADHINLHPDRGFRVAGFLIDDESPYVSDKEGKVLGRISDIRTIAEEVKPSLIVVGLTERRQRMPLNDLLELRFAGYAIQEAGMAYEAVCSRICTKELRPSQLIFTEEFGPRQSVLNLQRATNLVISAIGIVVSLPLMLLVAIAVALTSRGPVLYRQTRVGQHGKLFTLYKFRSMKADAEAETGAVWAPKNDPRITWVGWWLRMLRFDELPQFFNVLRGEMSLVGPRPERPEFVSELNERIPYYRQRHCVKPGITGWAQINHEYGDSMEDSITKLEYDLYYIKHLSPSLDFYILFQTFKTIILTRGAQ
jgi:sugar transferase (PEP-CTERM system associated)